MPAMNHRIRTLLVVILLLAAWLLVAGLAGQLIDLADRWLALPPWLRWLIAGLLAGFAVATVALGWRLLRPDRRARQPELVDRAQIDERIRRLDGLGGETGSLHEEVAELDRRKREERPYLAVFGEISAGKSSLIAALAPERAAAIERDALGGTTREVIHHQGAISGSRQVIYADVPGNAEVDGENREQMARAEAIRAHVVLYVCAGDLTRRQADELRWLAGFGKPIVLVLNKTDQWTDLEREQLVARLEQRFAAEVVAVVAATAGSTERFERRLADGAMEQVARQRPGDVQRLHKVLRKILDGDAQTLEAAREHAVLARLDEQTGVAEQAARQRHSEAIVRRYARRAVVGAMAAVVPGSDLIIQGALASAMTRELASLHKVSVRELELEEFLKHARLTVRTSASVVLAIAGNALKAFPGLGTLGGGVLHAFAYALIFDSLGKALATTFASVRELDRELANAHLKQLLGEARNQRLKDLAALTLEAIRDREPPAGKGD